MSTFGLSFVGRFDLFWSVLYQRFHCTLIWHKVSLFFVERLSSFKGDYLSFVGRFVLFWSVPYQRFHCTPIWHKVSLHAATEQLRTTMWTIQPTLCSQVAQDRSHMTTGRKAGLATLPNMGPTRERQQQYTMHVPLDRAVICLKSSAPKIVLYCSDNRFYCNTMCLLVCTAIYASSTNF